MKLNAYTISQIMKNIRHGVEDPIWEEWDESAHWGESDDEAVTLSDNVLQDIELLLKSYGD